MDEKEKKLDPTDPAFVMAFIVAAISDFSWIFILGIGIPVFGIVVAGFLILGHYLAALIVGFFVFPKIKGLLAGLVMILALVLPLPLLTIGIILGIILSNKYAEFLAIQAIALATGGAGEALEVGAVAAETAEGAAAVAETAEVAAAGAEAVGAGAGAAEGAAVSGEAAAGAERAGVEGAVPEKGVSEEQLGLEEEPGKVKEMERVKKLMEELPQPEREEQEDEGEEDNLEKAA